MVSTEPPLVDLKVTNPVTYLRRWWQKVIGNEGMEIKFKIYPLAMMAIAVIVTGMALGVGKFVISKEIPFFRFERVDVDNLMQPPVVASVTPDPWRQTGFTGTVQYSSPSKRFYLLTSSSAEAITLEVPSNFNMENLVGKRIFVTGNYNKTNRTLVVLSATDLEVLPAKPSIVPTTTPTVIPVPTTTETP